VHHIHDIVSWWQKDHQVLFWSIFAKVLSYAANINKEESEF
jgi:hypothetical protein